MPKQIASKRRCQFFFLQTSNINISWGTKYPRTKLINLIRHAVVDFNFLSCVYDTFEGLLVNYSYPKPFCQFLSNLFS